MISAAVSAQGPGAHPEAGQQGQLSVAAGGGQSAVRHRKYSTTGKGRHERRLVTSSRKMGLRRSWLPDERGTGVAEPDCSWAGDRGRGAGSASGGT